MIEIATAVIPDLVKSIPKVIELFRGKDSPPVSAALATGYYGNFLCPLYMQLSTGYLVVVPRAKAKRPQKFAARNVTVTILLPKRLDQDGLNRCDEEYRKLGPDEGAFRWLANNRYYSFRYKPECGADKKAGLTIVDVARPLFAVETFHRHVKHFNAAKKPRLSANEWEKIQAREVKGFAAAIDYLWENGSFAKLNRPGFLYL